MTKRSSVWMATTTRLVVAIGVAAWTGLAGQFELASEARASCMESATPGWSLIELEGRRVGDNTFELTLQVERGREGERMRAVAVVAEPSGVVLAVHRMGPLGVGGLDDLELRGALSSTEFDPASGGRPRYRLQWTPEASTGFTVKAVYDGRLLPVFRNARGDLNALRVGIEFDAEPFFQRIAAIEDGRAVEPLATGRPYRVCCGCSRQDGSSCRECITCTDDPPSPICSCPGCDVSCG